MIKFRDVQKSIITLLRAFNIHVSLRIEQRISDLNERKREREKEQRLWRAKTRWKRMRTAASTKEGAAPYAARFNVLVLNGRHPSTPGGSRASAVETSSSLVRSSAFHDPYPRTKDDRGRRETSNEWEYHVSDFRPRNFAHSSHV